MKALALWTLKGGVGKTAAAVNLAHAAAVGGLRTLLWDLDPQSSASFYLRIAPRLKAGVDTVARRSAPLADHLCASDYPNLSVLPADFALRMLDRALDAKKKPTKRLATKLAPLARLFDVVLIDCPPSVSLVSEAIVRAVDAVAVPVIPTTLSLRSLNQVRTFVAETSGPAIQVLPFLSMVDRRKRMHREAVAECLADESFLRASIPTSSEVEKMGVRRMPVSAHQASHPAARAYAQLWAELATHLGLA
jgi:chromosome partitioning protein